MILKKKFVAVIGSGTAGKSSIISALSGCRTSNYFDFIVDNLTFNSVFVCSGSPQEAPKLTLKKISTKLKAAQRKVSCSGMVMAVQPSNPTKRVSMEDIVKEALNQNFDVYAFVLEPGYNQSNAGLYQQVGQRLTALDVAPKQIFPLDGRQFAIKNATAINSITSLFT